MAMTTRFCSRCETDVQDAGGYCLLGHPLALKPLDASLGELREEIDQAFEDARLEVAAVVSGTEITQPIRVAPSTPPPPPPPPASVTAPDRPRRVGPPPPPPPRTPRPVAEPAAPVLREAVVEEPQAFVEAREPETFEGSPESEARMPAPEAVVFPEMPAPVTSDSFYLPQPAAPESPDELPGPETFPAPLPPAALDSTEFPVEGDVLARKFPVWQELEEASPLVGDPIGAFAPPPHMDWGPEKSTGKLLKRKPTRLRRSKREE